MGIFSRLRSTRTSIAPVVLADRSPAPQEPATAAAGTSQVTRDSEAWRSPWYVPRNRYQRLDLFRKSYEEIAILNQGIEALVLLSNGNLLGASGDSGMDEFVLELLDRINFANVLDRSLRQFFCYGMSLDEIVWSSDFRQIVKVHVVDARTVYISKTPQGDIQDFLQIPPVLFLLSSRTPMSDIPGVLRIPTERTIFCNRSPLGDNVYGTSILQALIQSGLPRTLQMMETSKGMIAHRFATQAQHFNFNPPVGARFNQAEADKIMTSLREAVGKRKIDDDVYTAGPISNTTLFQAGMDMTSSEQFVLEQIMSGLQLVPELFGYSFGQAQSQTREKLSIMLDRIERVRKQREHVINTRLMPAIETTYNLPRTPKVRFEHPRLIDAKLDAEKFSIWITYIQQILRMGLIDVEQAARMLELPGVFDKGRAEKWLDQQGNETVPTNELRQNDNQVSQTKPVLGE